MTLSGVFYEVKLEALDLPTDFLKALARWAYSVQQINEQNAKAAVFRAWLSARNGQSADSWAETERVMKLTLIQHGISVYELPNQESL